MGLRLGQEDQYRNGRAWRELGLILGLGFTVVRGGGERRTCRGGGGGEVQRREARPGGYKLGSGDVETVR